MMKRGESVPGTGSGMAPPDASILTLFAVQPRPKARHLIMTCWGGGILEGGSPFDKLRERMSCQRILGTDLTDGGQYVGVLGMPARFHGERE